MWLCVGKRVQQGGSGSRFTLCHIHKEGIRALTHFKRRQNNAAGLIMAVVKFILTVIIFMSENFPNDYYTAINLMSACSQFPCHAESQRLILRSLWEGCIKGLVQQKDQTLFTPLRLFLHPSFSHQASDVRLIEPRAQPHAVRSGLMESTWLTDKPTENKLSESRGPFIYLLATCGTALTPPNAISERCFIFTVLKLRFNFFLFIMYIFLFLVT